MGLLQVDSQETEKASTAHLASEAHETGFCGGRGGIRTHGALLGLTAFRERHLKPLGHPSAGEYNTVPNLLASSR